MDSYLIDNQRKLHVCGNNPACDGYEIEEGEFRLKGYDGPVVECDKCGSEMHLKMGRFGKYMGCTNENCKTPARSCATAMSRRRRRSGAVAGAAVRESDAYFVLRDGAAGVFLAANTFPKSRETRAPLVEELARFRIACRRSCAIWPMRRWRMPKAIKRWCVSAVKQTAVRLF